MTGALRRTTFAALLFLPLFLAGCAGIHLTQSPDEAIVRAGSNTAKIEAASLGRALSDYAVIADQAHRDSVYQTGRVELPSGTFCFPWKEPGCTDVTPVARKRIAQWQMIYASMDSKDFACVPGRTPCTEPLKGLGVQIWIRRANPCAEIVVAFRGTDFQSADDWISNLRWFTRLLPLYDQYEQVQDHTGRLVDLALRQTCYRRGVTTITAVGHSLGGGLAQQASYVDPRIRQVIAIDPSVVTGALDRHVRENFDATVKGLTIERIYEHGEALAYLRLAQREVLPISPCNPAIRTIRFQTVHGNPVGQHSVAALTSAFLYWSASSAPQQRIADLPKPNPGDCKS